MDTTMTGLESYRYAAETVNNIALTHKTRAKRYTSADE
eukprot:gene16385-18697_t